MPTIRPINKNAGTDAAKAYAAFGNRLDHLPNFFGTLANSPAALKAYVACAAELDQGELSHDLGEQIALAVSGENSSPYCAAVHTRLARDSGVSEDEAALNVQGISSVPRTGLILQFAIKLIRLGGKLSESDVNLLRDQEISDGEIIEIIAHTAFGTFGNFLNNVAQTEHDASAVAIKDYSSL